MNNLILVSILFLGIQLTSGLRCYTCTYSERAPNPNDACKSNPSLEPLTDFEENPGQSVYCSTDMKTINGSVRVERNVHYSERNDLNGTCNEGPLEGGLEPEKNYFKSCYCRWDKCNTLAYTPPPAITSPIKCYICGSLDSQCDKDPSSTYLMSIPAVPWYIKSRSVSSVIYPGFNIMGVRQDKTNNAQDRFSEPQQWSTYCMTTLVKGSDGSVELNRNATWSRNRLLDSKCEQSLENKEITHCYCNKKDGCNDGSGAAYAQLSLFVLFIGALLSMRTQLMSI